MTNSFENIDLSVIIVNYNVEYFLEQCLNSVFQASRDLNIEVFVVDNNSIDGSVKMIKERFKSVHLIENKTNNGFSKANNQAIKIAKGKHILLLNPDTVIEENTFQKEALLHLISEMRDLKCKKRKPTANKNLRNHTLESEIFFVLRNSR